MSLIYEHSGLGDVLLPPEVDTTTLITLGVAAIALVYVITIGGKTTQRRKPVTRVSQRQGLNGVDKDVIQALVGQGAGKAQATQAVMKARQKGATGFEGLFRGSLKEL